MSSDKKTYEEIFKELKDMNCLLYSETKSRKHVGEVKIFFVKGCRYSLKLRRQPIWFTHNDKGQKITLEWFFKTKKYRKKLEPVKFEDVLDSRNLNKKAREQFIFNIDLFRG